MRVWIQAPFDNLPEEGFRKQRYRLLAEAFAAAGHDVTYWTSDFNHGTKAHRVSGATAAPLPKEWNAAPNFRVRLVPTRPYAANVCLARIRSHRAYARAWKRLAAFEPAPELLVAATPTLSAATAALHLAGRFGARLAIDIQDAWPETFLRLVPRPLAPLGRLALAPLFRAARSLYAAADVVTGVSERYRAISGRTDYALFYHGFEQTALPRPRAYVAHSRLVYLGNLGEGYDLDTVLRALAEDEELSLDIAGKGPREQELKALTTELGLSSRVRFHGYLGAAAVHDLLAKSDVGLIPMRDDSWVGLPYKLADYLAAGLPVVSSLHGECGRLLIERGLGAVYASGSSSGFLEALRSLPTDAPVALPDELNAERIYPKLVALLTCEA